MAHGVLQKKFSGLMLLCLKALILRWTKRINIRNSLYIELNSGVKFTPLVFFAQDYVSPYKTCRLVSMLSERDRLHHISFSFYDTFDGRRSAARNGRPKVAPTNPNQPSRRGELRSPAYNNFTNYAVSICKSQEIIPQYLLFHSAMLY